MQKRGVHLHQYCLHSKNYRNLLNNGELQSGDWRLPLKFVKRRTESSKRQAIVRRQCCDISRGASPTAVVEGKTGHREIDPNRVINSFGRAFAYAVRYLKHFWVSELLIEAGICRHRRRSEPSAEAEFGSPLKYRCTSRNQEILTRHTALFARKCRHGLARQHATTKLCKLRAPPLVMSTRGVAPRAAAAGCNFLRGVEVALDVPGKREYNQPRRRREAEGARRGRPYAFAQHRGIIASSSGSDVRVSDAEIEGERGNACKGEVFFGR